MPEHSPPPAAADSELASFISKLPVSRLFVQALPGDSLARNSRVRRGGSRARSPRFGGGWSGRSTRRTNSGCLRLLDAAQEQIDQATRVIAGVMVGCDAEVADTAHEFVRLDPALDLSGVDRGTEQFLGHGQ